VLSVAPDLTLDPAQYVTEISTPFPAVVELQRLHSHMKEPELEISP
jgi:hypothetical protein